MPSDSSVILITCPKGLAPLLRAEVEALGLAVTAERPSGVETRGTLADAMRLNLWVRTGHRVLWGLRQFGAASADDLYAGCAAVPWEIWLHADGYFSVRGAIETPSMRDTRFALLRCKDAVCDRLRQRCGMRPDSGSEPRGAAVFLHWEDYRCSVYLDTTGESLSKRGYRRIPMEAPLRETLAAGIVLATGWRGDAPFVNPMCGSGTLAIEAAWLGLGRAPGILREYFAFQHIKGFDPRDWQALRDAARQGERSRLAHPVVATDLRPGAVEASRRNAQAAGVEAMLDFSACDFADTPVPGPAPVIVLNPEYGERMGDPAALEPEYKRIGRWLRATGQGGRGYVFTGNLRLAKRVGLKAGRIQTFFNGALECRLLEFPLFGAEAITSASCTHPLPLP